MPYHRLVRYENESALEGNRAPDVDGLHDLGAFTLQALENGGYFERVPEATALVSTILELGEQLGLIRWEEDDRHA